jgi:hypothetical protein
MDNFHKAEYVYLQMMDDADHERVQRFLEASFKPSAGRTLEWTSADTGLHYVFYLDTRTLSESGPGWRTGLTVDLNPMLGLDNNSRYRKQVHPNFSVGTDGKWALVPVGGTAR